MKYLKSKFNRRTLSTASETLVPESPYTVTFDSRDLYLTDEINSWSVQHIIESINAINKLDDFESRNYSVINCEYNPPPINIYINSPGGECMAALSLITTIESSETPIHTHCIGEASSAALFIFSVGHERYAYKHSIFMYHQMSAGAVGTFKDIDDQFKTLKHLQERLEEIFTLYTTFTKEELEKIRSLKQDYTFYYQEALEKGLADKIVLNSVYTKDLDNLKDNSKVKVSGFEEDGAIEKVESVAEESVFDIQSKLNEEDLDDLVASFSDEELEKALKHFLKNKIKKSKKKKDND